MNIKCKKCSMIIGAPSFAVHIISIWFCPFLYKLGSSQNKDLDRWKNINHSPTCRIDVKQNLSMPLSQCNSHCLITYIAHQFDGVSSIWCNYDISCQYYKSFHQTKMLLHTIIELSVDIC
jgi:hypothetical protein